MSGLRRSDGRAIADRAAVLVFLLFLFPAPGWAAAYGSISGIVRDDGDRPIAGAKVVLESAAHAITEQQTDSAGRFAFPKVEIGQYMLTISRRDFASLSQPVTVEAGYFPFASILLKELAEVTVTASALPVVASVTPITMVSQEDIKNTPGASNVNSNAMITDYVPGAYQAHDMLHMRGGHQTNWLIDGVEIPNTNIAENLGPALNPQDVETLGVERGSYLADEGDRTYGIFNVIPKSGFSSNNQAQLDLTAGNFAQTDDYLSVASHTNDFAYYASLEGNRSNLGLQTPVSQVIHDESQGYGAFTNLQYKPNEQDAISFIGQLRQDVYQIPDCTEPLDDDPYCVGQIGDAQKEADNFALLSWTHTFSNDAVLTSSLLYHFERADYDGDASDYPTVTTYHHSSQYEGAEENLRMNFSRNHLDVGLFGFAQQDQAAFNLAFTDGSSPTLQELESPTGGLIAAWVQDTFEAAHWLNLSAGVRQSHFQSSSITENTTDPRLGATVLLPRLNWVLSAFWGKYYQAPPLETLSGPLVAYATANDTAFLPLHGERDEEHQFGVTIPVKGWSIQADRFSTNSTNFFDHNPLGESNIFLPITTQGAHIVGTEITVRSPAFWPYGQVHLAYSNQTADCFGSITGGLVVLGTDCGFPPVALDHDQRNTLNLGYNANLPRQFFVGSNLSFNSGLANDGEPSHLPSYTVLDLTVGRNLSRDLSVSITGLNLTNAHLLTDNSLTFGGVHWNNPFQIYAEIRYKLQY